MSKGCVRFKKLEDLPLDVGRTVARVPVGEPSMSLIPFAPFFLLPSSFYLSWFVSDSATNDDTRDAIIARLAKAAWDRAQSLGR